MKNDLATQTKEAIEAWKRCLDHHKASRGSLFGEDLTIGRMVQQHGIDAVLLAFMGAQYEPESRDFKPSRYLSLKRIFDPQKFERFVNLGAQAKNQMEVKRLEEENERKKFAPSKDNDYLDPERVRQITSGLFGKNNK